MEEESHLWNQNEAHVHTSRVKTGPKNNVIASLQTHRHYRQSTALGQSHCCSPCPNTAQERVVPLATITWFYLIACWLTALLDTGDNHPLFQPVKRGGVISFPPCTVPLGVQMQRRNSPVRSPRAEGRLLWEVLGLLGRRGSPLLCSALLSSPLLDVTPCKFQNNPNPLPPYVLPVLLNVFEGLTSVRVNQKVNQLLHQQEVFKKHESGRSS